MTRLWAAAVVLVGCYSPNASVGQPCSSLGDCPSGQRCDMSQAPPTCVIGGGNGGDGGATDATPPIIDGLPVASDSSGSISCSHDSDCPSSACDFYNGACTPMFDVLYVDGATGNDGGACTQATPCRTIGYALTQVNGPRRTLKIADADYDETITIDDNLGGTSDTVVFLGDPDQGAEIEGGGITINGADVRIENFGVDDAGSDGILLENGCNLVLADAWITDAVNDGLKALDTHGNNVQLYFTNIEDNDNLGIHLKGGMLTMDSDGVIDNAGGIVLQDGQHASIINSVIVENGNSDSTVGGVQLQDQAKLTAFSFNTVADNATNGSAAGGVACGSLAAPSGTMFVIDDTIFSGNTPTQTDCNATYSLFGSGGDFQGGEGDVVGDPAFLNPQMADYHITTTSTARNAADPSATLDHDIDAQSRPQGPARDIGCDEIK